MSQDTPYVGALTAVKNSPIAMTVSEIFYKDAVGDAEPEVDHVQAVYFTGQKLNHFAGNVDAFVGFGEELAFSGGAFQYAFGLPEEEEEEEEEEELEEEEQDAASGKPANA